MADKRTLKKEIRRICGSIAGEVIAASLTVPGIDKEKCDHVVVEAARLQDRALRRISTPYPRAKESFDSGREYRAARYKYYQEAYADIKKEFNDRVEALVKEMNALLPAEQKEANKKKA